jgi:tetratricopeptide (TPR) repeat protein
MSSTLVCQTCGALLVETAGGSFCPGCALCDQDEALDDTTTVNASAGTGTARNFGDYDLLDEIGRGGMGLVFKARQRSLGRLVALKVLLTGRFSDLAARERFQREAESAARLQHPNIVAIHEIGEIEGHPYFTMDLVAGKNLAELCEGRALPSRRAAEWLRDVALAVQAAHTAGVLHRDLKPSNILVGDDGRPRVTDFGLARRTDDRDGLTLSGQMLGSPNYTSPEQAAGRHDAITNRSDVYGLGAVLFHLVTGRAPFNAAGTGETLRLVLTHEPPAPRKLNPTLPSELETICLKCLQKDPAQRYASAAEVADELENFLRERPLRARPPGRAYVAQMFIRRNKLLVGAAAGIALALLGGMSISTTFWWRERAANRRVQAAQVQAEKLVNLLLRDVRPSIEQFGRVAELDRFAEETVRYFAELPPELRDASYAGNHAIALSVLAWVRWRGGDFKGATTVASESLAWRQRVLDESPTEFRRIAPLMRDVISLRDSGCAVPTPLRPRAESNVRTLRELVSQHPADLHLAKELAIELMGLAMALQNPDAKPEAGRSELGEAKAIMRHVLDRAPDERFFALIHADAVLALSWVYKYCGDYERAVAEAREAVASLKATNATRPGNLLVLDQLAHAEHALAEHWAPLSLARARELEIAARGHFQTLHTADPDHPLWREMFGYSHAIEAWYAFNCGKFAEAREQLAKFKAICESFPVTHQWTNPMLLPWRYIEDGEAAAALGDFDSARVLVKEARVRFDKVIASRPADSPVRVRNGLDALLGEATLFTAIGDWLKVETAASDALKIAEAYPREDQRRGIKRFDRGEAYRFLGLAQLRRNRAAEAVTALREAEILIGAALPVRHAFTSRELRLADTRDTLGEALISLGNVAEARRVLAEALAFREADLARQPELAAAQFAFANTAALYASTLDPNDRESGVRRRDLLARSTAALAPPAGENRLTRDQQQLANRIAGLVNAGQ